MPEELKKAKQNGDLIIGVDRGSLLLMQMKIKPDLMVGDYDSLKQNELAKIEKEVADIRYSNPVKDLTDSELMLQYAFKDYQVDELTIFGATGGRLDHFLVNLLMILNPEIKQFARQLTLIDCQNIIKFYLPGLNRINKIAGFPYFGVMNLEAVSELSICGARYQLKKYTSNVPKMFSSNEFLPKKKEFSLSFRKGLVAVIFSKDVNRFQSI